MKTKMMGMLGSLLLTTLSCNTQAAIVYFGENLTPGGVVSGDPLTAHDEFIAQLTAGVSTENFEGLSSLNTLTFTGSAGTIGASLSGSANLFSSGGAGRFPTSGSNYVESSGSFTINFTQEIAAFGFYATDIGDFNGQVTVELIGGGTDLYTINNTINAPDSSLLFWGIIDTVNTFSSITFGNTNAGTDFFGFDDMTIGDVGQIVDPNAVSEPMTAALLGLGLAGIAARRRRKS